VKLVVEKNPAGQGSHKILTGNNFFFKLAEKNGDGLEEEFDITNGLTGLDLHMNLGEINRVEISFKLDDVEIDIEALLALQVHVETKEAIAAERRAIEREEQALDHPERTEKREDGESDAQ
jgi:hypothetical protein